MTLLTGFHHVAVVTGDLDRFIEFYASIFDAQSIPIEPTPAFRHALVRVGSTATLHPVELKSHWCSQGIAAPLARGHLDHLALHAPSREILREIRRRLMARGASDGAVMDLGPMLSLAFIDSDGMHGEVCWNRDPALRELHAPQHYVDEL